MTTLLAEKIFGNCNSSHLIQYTVNQSSYTSLHSPLFDICILNYGPRPSSDELYGPPMGLSWPAMS